MEQRKEKTKKGFWLDPRSKLLIILSMNGLVVTGVENWVLSLIVVFLGVLLMLSKYVRSAVKFMLTFAVLLFIEIIVWHYVTTGPMVYIIVFTGLVKKFIPAIMSAMVFIYTTTVSELASALARMHVPEKMILPILVILRFFPTVQEEWDCIKDAMKMRGIGNGVKSVLSPMRSMEYTLVPLISTSVKTGEELSASALTRGLGAPVKRTNSCQVGFSWPDFLVIAVAAVFFVLITF